MFLVCLDLPTCGDILQFSFPDKKKLKQSCSTFSHPTDFMLDEMSLMHDPIRWKNKNDGPGYTICTHKVGSFRSCVPNIIANKNVERDVNKVVAN